MKNSAVYLQAAQNLDEMKNPLDCYCCTAIWRIRKTAVKSFERMFSPIPGDSGAWFGLSAGTTLRNVNTRVIALLLMREIAKDSEARSLRRKVK